MIYLVDRAARARHHREYLYLLLRISWQLDRIRLQFLRFFTYNMFDRLVGQVDLS
ncbi:hypothetical protein [Chamaesiphon sp. VAR_69_metabat_338]|uniref:hypothetical protein n=1 Tax=Chamaesiphon sp. VAR_69_metabat_338 TaxID=2964704 RepID=UPI00286DC933|nr:hypothetical protein [Chamaesiphon sp. VAR_69_metabat_338]